MDAKWIVFDHDSQYEFHDNMSTFHILFLQFFLFERCLFRLSELVDNLSNYFQLGLSTIACS